MTYNNIKLLVGGGGNGYIHGLRRGDEILMQVTYDGYNNTIYAKVTDVNTSSVITLDLPLNSTFSVPSDGRYWTEVNAGTGASFWNWGLTFVSVMNNVM